MKRSKQLWLSPYCYIYTYYYRRKGGGAGGREVAKETRTKFSRNFFRVYGKVQIGYKRKGLKVSPTLGQTMKMFLVNDGTLSDDKYDKRQTRSHQIQTLSRTVLNILYANFYTRMQNR
jgi:hypothetical protein